MAVKQHTRLTFLVLIRIHHFIAGLEVQGGLATLLGGQIIARATKEHASTPDTNLHISLAIRTANIRGDGMIAAHAVFIVFGFDKACFKVFVESIQHTTPFTTAFGDAI